MLQAVVSASSSAQFMSCVERQENTLDLLRYLSPHVILLWFPLLSIRFPPLLCLVVSVNASIHHLAVRSHADEAHLSWGLTCVVRDALVTTSDLSTNLWPLVLVGKLLLTRCILYFILRKPQRDLCVKFPSISSHQFVNCSCLQPSTESHYSVSFPHFPSPIFLICHRWPCCQMMTIFTQINRRVVLDYWWSMPVLTWSRGIGSGSCF